MIKSWACNSTYGLIARLQLPIHLLVHLSDKGRRRSLGWPLWAQSCRHRAVMLCDCGGKVGVTVLVPTALAMAAPREEVSNVLGLIDGHAEDVGGDLHDLVALRTAAGDH